MGADRVDEGLGVAVDARRAHGDAGADGRGEDLPLGRVEAHRGLLQDDRARGEVVFRRHPAHLRRDRAVLDHDALRPARGARGVDDVREVRLPDVVRLRLLARGAPGVLDGVAEGDHGRTGRGEVGDAGAEVVLGDDDAGGAVLDHVPDAFLRVVGGEGDVGGAGADGAPGGGDQFEGGVGVDADAVVGAGAEVAEVLGQDQGALGELPEGEGVALVGDGGGGVGVVQGLGVEETVERAHGCPFLGADTLLRPPPLWQPRPPRCGQLFRWGGTGGHNGTAPLAGPRLPRLNPHRVRAARVGAGPGTRGGGAARGRRPVCPPVPPCGTIAHTAGGGGRGHGPHGGSEGAGAAHTEVARVRARPARRVARARARPARRGGWARPARRGARARRPAGRGPRACGRGVLPGAARTRVARVRRAAGRGPHGAEVRVSGR